jgi:hypothetical protein
LNSGSAASPAADSFALAVSSGCSSSLPVWQEFPESPDFFPRGVLMKRVS